jgi:hypothetical protein
MSKKYDKEVEIFQKAVKAFLETRSDKQEDWVGGAFSEKEIAAKFLNDFVEWLKEQTKEE